MDCSTRVSPNGVAAMQLPDSIRRCSAFIGFSTAERGNRLAGTVFFVAELQEGSVERRWAVTAAHVLRELKSFTTDPDSILVRINRAESAEWISFQRQRWTEHPDAARDVAVMQIADDELEGSDALFFPLNRIVDAHAINRWGVGVGDEVLITGLFRSHLDTTRNIPIVRVGVLLQWLKSQSQRARGILRFTSLKHARLGALVAPLHSSVTVPSV